MSATGLTDQQVRMLVFEEQRWKYSGAKETAIKEAFGLSASRYYQALNALLDVPAALEAAPVLVRRLMRLRDARRGQRAASIRVVAS